VIHVADHEAWRDERDELEHEVALGLEALEYLEALEDTGADHDAWRDEPAPATDELEHEVALGLELDRYRRLGIVSALVLVLVLVLASGACSARGAVPVVGKPGAWTPTAGHCVKCDSSPVPGAVKPPGYGGAVIAPCGNCRPGGIVKPGPIAPSKDGIRAGGTKKK
jgi:hypothetical protein